MPKNAEEIARLLNQGMCKNLSRTDVMMAFGEKSYLLAEVEGKTVGLAGFQVENLITRMDEFVVIPEAPVGPVTEGLVGAAYAESGGTGFRRGDSHGKTRAPTVDYRD